MARGWLVGAMLGAALLVVAPMLDTLDTNYLIPAHWRLLLVVAAVVSALGVATLPRVRLGDALAWMAAMPAGIVCAFVLRVAIDVRHDRTDHNLLPFELAIDFVAALRSCALGAAIGYVGRRLADHSAGDGPWRPSWK